MKKLLYTLSALAAVFIVAGCERELRDSSAQGESTELTFTVAAPDVVTKAIGDGTGATELTFAVYDEAGNYLQDLSESAATISGANPTWTVSVPVVKDLTYQFAFVAKAAAGPYAVDPAAKTVTATYGNANDDAADLFVAAKTITITDALNETIKLVRPLAQVNVGAADLVAAAYSLDVENMTTGLKLTGINNVLNILDGTVSGAAEITLAEAARVNEASQFVSGYDRIAMGYVLVGEKQTSDATINITAKGKADGADKVITREVANIPLQANYRTNILGNIFTSSMNFTVTVEPEFDTPEYNETLETNIEKANTLFAAGQTSVTVDLAPAEDGETTVTLPATTGEVRLNLNITTDKTITVQYAEGAKPAKVEIYAKDIEALVADLTSSTVTITAGSHIHNGTFKTAATTLIIEATAKVDNLVVNAGATKIYGEVGTISGDAAADAAYYVKDLAGLQALRDAVNSGVSYKDKTIYLEEDIDLSSIADWEPIGSTDHNFSGIFDGNGKTVSNLTIEYNSPEKAHQGLFGTIASATVQNINVNNVNINVQSSGSGAAAVVGYSAGSTKVLNVNVKNVTIRANRWGGGVANGYATIQNCSSDNVDILLVPNVKDDSFDNGDKGGGIVGWHGEGAIEISGNTANNVTIRGYRDIGGITGIAHNNNIVKNNTVTNSTIIRDAFTNAYADESKNAGKVIGRYYSAVTEEGNVAGDDVEVIGLFADGINEDESGILHILSKTGFESFRNLVNASNGAAIYSGKTFVLDTDIDLNNEEWTPIGFKADSRSFVGTFDGNDHTIANLYINVSGAISGGLFGADDGCTIKNLVIDGAEIHNVTSHSASGTAVVLGANQNIATTIENVTVKNAKVYGNRRVSAIAGYYKGTITGCTVENVELVATVDELSGAGKYDNGDKVGGVLGYANGDCTITNNAVSNFSFTGYRHIGGLAGYIANSANVKNNTIKDGTLIGFSEHVDVDNHAIGDGTSEVIGKGSTADDTNTFENIRMIVNGEETLKCSISDDYKLYKEGGVQFTAEEFEDMSGKIIYEKDGKFILTSKTVAQLTAAATEGSTLTLYLIKGENYIIQTGRSSGVIDVNVIGISDYDGNKMSSVQMDNASDGETHSYRSNLLNLTVKNLILVSEDTDANGDNRHGAGFCYANSLLVEDCVFTKSQCLWNQNGHTFTVKNSTFNCSGIGNKYAMWTRGDNSIWNFENCVFNEDGKALKIFHTTGTVNVTNCTFNKVGDAADKYCVEIDCTATVNITNCTNNGHKGISKND